MFIIIPVDVSVCGNGVILYGRPQTVNRRSNIPQNKMY